MLTKLITFETGYHFRQTAWWLAATAFLGLGFLTVRGNFGGDEVHRNSPYAITVVISLLSLCTIFAATVFCAGALLRDKTFRMDALVYTTTIRRVQYFGVKFAGLFVAVFSLLCLAALGVWMGSETLAPAYRGPSGITHYLQPLLVFGLPNVLFTCAILFSISMYSWNAKVVYAGGVMLYILYLTASVLGGSPMLAGTTGTGQSLTATLSDPYGLAPFFGGTRFWTDAQRNTQLYPLSGMLLLNRTVWAVVGAGLVWSVYQSFRLTITADAPKQQFTAETVPLLQASYKPAYTHPSGIRYLAAAFGTRLRLEASSVCLHVPFLLMMGLWAFYTAVELSGSLRGFYGITSIAGSGQIAQHLLAVRPAILLIIFYAAELTFAERSSRTDGIIDSTPLPTGILWAAKCTALAVMAVAIVTVNVITGMATQCIHGQFTFNWGIYGSLYWYAAFPLMLHGVLAIFILTLVRRKFAGMVVCLLIILPVLFGSRFGTEHPMLRFALPQHFKWTDMNGFGREALAFGWFMIYWGALAAMMAVLTVRAWRQGWKGWVNGWNASGRIALFVSFAIFITTGGYIYKRMHTDGHYRSSAAANAWMAAYEKKIQSLSPAHQPYITAVHTHIHLLPHSGQYTVDGEYIIQNNSTRNIDTLLTGISPEVQRWEVSIEGARLLGADDTLQVKWFQLLKPLQPGDTMRVKFHVKADRSGFVPFNSEHSVALNGSYIEFGKYLPYFGFNAAYMLEDRLDRAEAQLPETLTYLPADTQYHLIEYRTTITTAEDQTALAPGRLVRSWKQGSEAHFLYETDGPVTEGFAISSGRYAEMSRDHHGRKLTIYHHPSHTTNLTAIMNGMLATVDYCETNYAPWPFQTLILAEIPSYPGAATAYPGIMFAKEQILFTADYRDTSRVNFAFATAAHETAHQWWAALLTPRSDSSYKFLTETMAKHVESRVLEHRYGRPKNLQYLEADRQYYYQMRNGNELPLVKSAGQNWVHYQKGALAMDTLTQVMGEMKVNAGMRELMQRYTPPYGKPDAEMLLQIWEREANADVKGVLERWFRNTKGL